MSTKYIFLDGKRKEWNFLWPQLLQSLDATFLSADLLKLLMEFSRADRSTVSLGDDSIDDVCGIDGMGGGGGGGAVNDDAENDQQISWTLWHNFYKLHKTGVLVDIIWWLVVWVSELWLDEGKWFNEVERCHKTTATTGKSSIFFNKKIYSENIYDWNFEFE